MHLRCVINEKKIWKKIVKIFDHQNNDIHDYLWFFNIFTYKNFITDLVHYKEKKTEEFRCELYVSSITN